MQQCDLANFRSLKIINLFKNFNFYNHTKILQIFCQLFLLYFNPLFYLISFSFNIFTNEILTMRLRKSHVKIYKIFLYFLGDNLFNASGIFGDLYGNENR